jgi:hypothetical protein
VHRVRKVHKVRGVRRVRGLQKVRLVVPSYCDASLSGVARPSGLVISERPCLSSASLLGYAALHSSMEGRS